MLQITNSYEMIPFLQGEKHFDPNTITVHLQNAKKESVPI